MKLYRYWAKEQGTITIPGTFRRSPETKQINCYGGSNLSMEDAIRRAQEKVTIVQKKVQKDWETIHSYQPSVEIREEIIDELDSKNIVTRNRYGALVLNSENMMMIDVDDAKNGILDLLKGHTGAGWKKPKILEMIEQLASRLPELSFMIYETSNGYRVLVTGRTFEPKAPETATIFRRFNADPLYARLCIKQECFRARLTPKPYRIKCKRHHVVYPRTQEEDVDLKSWIETYSELARNYASCKFIRVIGSSHGDPIIQYHDELTRAHEHLELA
jgi:hypothetical protein